MKKLLLFIFCTAALSAFSQKTPTYSLQSSSQLLANPAYAGVPDAFVAQLSIRSQWSNIPGSPLTTSLTAVTSIKERFGAGVLINNDKIGIFNNYNISSNFAFNVIEGDIRLVFGVSGGIIDKSFDYSLLATEVSNDDAIFFAENEKTSGVFGTGLLLNSDQFYLGISMLNLSSESRELYLSAGYFFDQIDLLRIRPSLMYRKTVDSSSMDINMDVMFSNSLWFGLGLRDFSNVMMKTQFDILEYLTVGYAFDIYAGDLAGNKLTSHEVGVRVQLAVFDSQVVRTLWF